MRLSQIAVLSFLSFPLWATGAPKVDRGPMPLFFIKNMGQYVAPDDITLQTADTSVQFRSREVVYTLSGGRPAILKVRYDGQRPVHADGLDELGGKVNFLMGADRNAWRTDVPTYSSLAYREMWVGVDVVYSLTGGSLKTEFQLAPGADPAIVRWHVAGADSISKGRDGSLIISAGDHELREAAPQVFEQQASTNELHSVPGAFRIFAGDMIGIEVGPYDHRNRLIFDPVIGFSTYLGGSGQSGANGVAVDSTGNTVIAGYTTTLDLASGATTIGSPQRTAAFVAKLTAAGNQLVFCTYLGGSLVDQANAVALDRWNNVYIAGAASSSNFPVLHAVQPTIHGSQDAFVAELNPAGNALVFSTYLGGSNADLAYGIAVNHQGDVFVTGDTLSTDFPTLSPIQATEGGGQDAFLVKLGVSGSAILFSTYLGGTADEHAAAIAVAASGIATITGSTFSTNFPVANALQAHTGGNQDVFVTSVNSAGNGLVFSTYLGGAGGTSGLPETGSGVAVDGSGSVYVTGTTSSSNFPVTVGSFETVPTGSLLNAFVLKLSASGVLDYSTYLGGSSANYGSAIAVDMAGNAHVVGYTASTDFPSLRGVQAALNGGYDAFVTKLNSTGSQLIYSTLIGGTLSDSAAAIAIDHYGTAVIAGQSLSTNFPTVSAFQTQLKGAESSFVARLPVGWTPMVYSSGGWWSVDYLTNAGSNGIAPAIQTISTFGAAGEIPFVGDWNRSGTQNIGVFANGTWFLDLDGNGTFDSGDRSFVFGQAGDIPVVGDWDGSGTVKAGLYRNGTFILDYSGHLSGVPTGKPDVTFAFGLPTDIPVAADWSGSGTTKVGVFRAGQWLLDNNGSHTINGAVKNYGQLGDRPLLGDWDGSGMVKAGVYRAGSFLLDYNGNWAIDAAGDVTLTFGAISPYALTKY